VKEIIGSMVNIQLWSRETLTSLIDSGYRFRTFPPQFPRRTVAPNFCCMIRGGYSFNLSPETQVMTLGKGWLYRLVKFSIGG